MSWAPNYFPGTVSQSVTEKCSLMKTESLPRISRPARIGLRAPTWAPKCPLFQKGKYFCLSWNFYPLIVRDHEEQMCDSEECGEGVISFLLSQRRPHYHWF